MDSVCVLLSTYNGETYIEEQLDSLLRQKDVDLRIVIRDDGSKDNTIKIIEDYIKNNTSGAGITLLESDGNLGPAKAFLELLKKAPSADYYAFCDQDDVWFDDKLSTAISMIRGADPSGEKPVLYHSNLAITDSQLNTIRISSKAVPASKYTCLVDNVVTGCTAVMNKPLYELLTSKEAGDITMHDAWINIVASFFGQVVFDESAHIYYRQHEHNVIGMKDNNNVPAYMKTRFKRMKNKALQPRLKNAVAFYEAYGDDLNQFDKKELEKIEMTRQTDNVYRLDHGVTKKQKRILQAFGVDVPLITHWAKEISSQLKEISAKAKKGSEEE